MKFIKYLIVIVLASSINYAQSQEWDTFYELSDCKETPRYDETIRYCKQLASNSSIIKYETFGTSPQGRSLPVLIVDKDSDFENNLKEKAVLMIQACIHPGESEGKDAGLMLLRDLVIFNKYPDLLDNVQIVFIPIFNVDGHERWGKYNRINQNGPEEMGWRASAQNLNLNRDYIKADTPEMQAWLKLFADRLPDFFIDCHTTDGADYQYVLTYAMETGANIDEGLATWQAEKYIPAMEKNMFEKGFPVFPYVQFRNWHDPRSGLEYGVATPMISQGYTALQNRPGLLIETHMLKPYKPRVESTYEMLKFSLGFINDNYIELKKLVKDADEKIISGVKDAKLGVKYEVSKDDSVMVDFLGVEYSVDKSDLTGGDWFKYSSVPATFNVPFFNKSIAVEEVILPQAYLIPVEWIEVINRLKYHNIKMHKEVITDSINVEVYRFSNSKWGNRPYEGRHRVSVDYTLNKEKMSFPNGVMVVPMNQRSAKVIAYMLEPMADNSLLSWGFFNTIFEQKEYGESYVMEPLAREMLKNDPELRLEFEKKKLEDPNFTKSTWSMLNWFYKKTSWWDDRVNMYPVLRLSSGTVLRQSSE